MNIILSNIRLYCIIYSENENIYKRKGMKRNADGGIYEARIQFRCGHFYGFFAMINQVVPWYWLSSGS